MKAKYDDIDEYIADLQAELAKNENCAAHLYNLGMALLSKRDFAAAEDAFLRAVRNSPSLAEAYVQLGGICLVRDDLDGCLRYNQEAASCRPRFAIPWGNIGFVHMQRGDPEQAIPALRKALKWDPKFIQARTTMATAMYMQGDYDAAIECGNEVVRQEANFGPAWNNLALAHFEKGEFARAVECADKAQECGFDVREEFLAELAPHRQ